MDKNFDKHVLRLLKEIVNPILGFELDLHQILRIILDKALQLVDAQSGRILLVEGNDLFVRATNVEFSLAETKYRINIDSTSVTGLSVLQKRVVVWEDIPELSDTHKSIAIPLIYMNQVIGVLEIEFSDHDALIQEQRDLLEALASVAVIAIQDARLFQQREALRKIDQLVLNKALDFDEKLKQYLEISLQIIGASYGQLFLRQGENYLIIRATTTIPADKELRTRLRIDNSVSGLTVLRKQPVIIGDVDGEPLYRRIIINSQPMQSELAVPIFDDPDHVIGVLNVESPRLNAFSELDKALLTILANQASILISSAYMDAIRKAENRIQYVLTGNSGQPQEIYDVLLREALQLVGAHSGQLLIVHPEYLTIHATTGSEKLRMVVHFDPSFCGRVVQTGKYEIASDLRDHKNRYIPILSEGNKRMLSELAVPVFDGEDMIGILNFESPYEDFFSDKDAITIEILAPFAAVALIRARDQEFEKEITKMMSVLAEGDVSNNEWLRQALTRSLELVKAIVGHFVIVEGEKLIILVAAGKDAVDKGEADLTLDNCIVGSVIKQRKLRRIGDVTEEALYQQGKKGGSAILSEIVIPLLHSGGVFAVLNLESTRRNAFTKRHEEMLIEFASAISLGYRLRGLLKHQETVFHSVKGRLALIEHNSRDAQIAITDGNNIKATKLLKASEEMANRLYEVVDRTVRPPKLYPIILSKFVEQVANEYPFPTSLDFSIHHNHADVIVAADPQMLKDTLNLIFDNAVEAMDKVPPKLTVSFEEENLEFMKVLIADNGKGMQPEILPRIFEGITTKEAVLGPAKGPNQSRNRGSGIGLPDARHMMYKMLGNITIAGTEPGKGTQMLLLLRKIKMVTIVTSRSNTTQSEIDGQSSYNGYLFTNYKETIQAFKRMTFSGDLGFKQERLPYQLSQKTLEAIDNHPYLIMIDMESAHGSGLALFDQLVDFRKHKNDKRRYEIYLSWKLPTKESGVNKLITEAIREIPKGWL